MKKYKVICKKDFSIDSGIFDDIEYKWIFGKIYDVCEYCDQGNLIDDCYSVSCEEDSGLSYVKNGNFVFYVKKGEKNYVNEFMENFTIIKEYRKSQINKILE